MNEENKKLVKELLWDKFNQYCCCIEHWGSSTVPYINNPKDIDLVIVCETEENAKYIRQKLRELRKSGIDYKEKYGFCIIVSLVTFFINNNFYWPYEYQCKYREILFGDKPRILHDLQLNSDEYFDSIVSVIKWLTNSKDGSLWHKHWYHIYNSLCIIENNSYELTEEQKQNVQKLHDNNRENYLENLELIKWCIEKCKLNIDELFNNCISCRELFKNNL